jgi:molybdopterin/thiamine biosynthesis adenylyltransferase
MITIIGAGALGSHVALFLRNIKHVIKIVDFDRVEQKNTMAQFHTKMGLRKNKAKALSQAMQGMFGTMIESAPHRLTIDNVNLLLDHMPLVLDCTDNIAARNLIQGHATDHGIPCLHGSLSADGSFARIMWSEDFEADAEGEGEGVEVTCVDGEHLPFFAAAAAYMAVEAQRFLETGKRRSFQLTPSGIIRLR